MSQFISLREGVSQPSTKEKCPKMILVTIPCAKFELNSNVFVNVSVWVHVHECMCAEGRGVSLQRHHACPHACYILLN